MRKRRARQPRQYRDGNAARCPCGGTLLPVVRKPAGHYGTVEYKCSRCPRRFRR